jgi:MATE family multidrug resistance protein
LIAQLSSMTQMLSDTVLAGRYGTEDLAAVAVASGIYISVVMLMVGILQAVAPTVAHHVGAGRRDEIGPRCSRASGWPSGWRCRRCCSCATPTG